PVMADTLFTPSCFFVHYRPCLSKKGCLLPHGGAGQYKEEVRLLRESVFAGFLRCDLFLSVDGTEPFLATPSLDGRLDLLEGEDFLATLPLADRIAHLLDTRRLGVDGTRIAIHKRIGGHVYGSEVGEG